MLTPYVIGLAFANCAATVCLTAVFRTLEFMEHQKAFDGIATWRRSNGRQSTGAFQQDES